MSYKQLTFRESLGFEDMGIIIQLNKPYIIREEYDNVVYILDDANEKIGFELLALDDTVIMEEVTPIEE